MSIKEVIGEYALVISVNLCPAVQSPNFIYFATMLAAVWAALSYELCTKLKIESGLKIAAKIVIGTGLLLSHMFAWSAGKSMAGGPGIVIKDERTVLENYAEDPCGVIQGNNPDPRVTSTFSYDASSVEYLSLKTCPIFSPNLSNFATGNLLRNAFKQNVLDIESSNFDERNIIFAGCTATTVFLEKYNPHGITYVNQMLSLESQSANCASTPAPYGNIYCASAECSPEDSRAAATSLFYNANYDGTLTSQPGITIGGNNFVSQRAGKALIIYIWKIGTGLQTLTTYYLNDRNEPTEAIPVVNLFPDTNFTDNLTKADDTANATMTSAEVVPQSLWIRFKHWQGTGYNVIGHQWPALSSIQGGDTRFREAAYYSSINRLVTTHVDDANNIVLAMYRPGSQTPEYKPRIIGQASLSQRFDNPGYFSMLNAQSHNPRYAYLKDATYLDKSAPAKSSSFDLTYRLVNLYY